MAAKKGLSSAHAGFDELVEREEPGHRKEVAEESRRGPAEPGLPAQRPAPLPAAVRKKPPSRLRRGVILVRDKGRIATAQEVVPWKKKDQQFIDEG